MPNNAVLRGGYFHPMDDSMRAAGRNGKPAIAAQLRRFADVLNCIGHDGRPIFHWWGGAAHDANITTGIFQTMYARYFGGGRFLRGRALILKPNSTRDSTQGIRLTLGDPDISGSTDQHDYPIEYDLASAAAPVDPTNLEEVGFGADLEPSDFELKEMLIGTRADSTPGNAPGLISGMIYEPAQIEGNPDAGASGVYVPQDLAIPGHDIVNVADTGDLKVFDRIRDMARHNWLFNRPHFSWSAFNPGVGSAGTNWIARSTAHASFRYIFDETIGDGGGTAASATGPGITVPIYKAASGVRTTLAIHLYVYAALSEASASTGRIGVACKQNSFTFTEITNGPQINSTTWQWWPAATIEPGDVSTSPFFLGDASAAFERILIGTRMSSADGAKHVKIGAFAMIPRHIAS